MSFTLRAAMPEDAEAIAAVYAASFRLLTFLPMLHTMESYRWYVANRMLKEWAVTVAEDDTGIVAFLGLRGEEVGHFYTARSHRARRGNPAHRGGEIERRCRPRTMVLPGQHARPALLRSPRLSRDPLHRRRG
jgi:hypothetical protein